MTSTTGRSGLTGVDRRSGGTQPSSAVETGEVGIVEADASPTTNDRRLAVGLVIVVVGLVAMALAAVLRHTWFPTNDIALIVLRSHDAFGHPPLVGPYSRYGFDHPGPLIFYAMAPFVRILGSSGALVAAAALAAGSIVVIGVVAWRRGGLWLVVLTATVLAVFVRAFASTVVNPWNPWVPVLPFFAVVLLAWSVWCRDWRMLPLLVVAASFAGQTHIGYLPLVALVLAAAFGFAAVVFIRGRTTRAADDHLVGDDHVTAGPRTADPPVADDSDLGADPTRWAPGAVAGSRPSARVLVGSLGLLVVLWLPPIVNQLFGANHNVTAISRHFLGRDAPSTDYGFDGGARPGAGQVAGTAALELGVPAPWMVGPETTDALTAEVVPGSAWRLVPSLAVFGLAALVGWRRRARDPLRLQAVVAGLSVIGVASLSRITGGVSDYLIRWLWVLGAAWWLSAAWTLVWSWRAASDRPAGWSRAARLAVVVPIVAVASAVPVVWGIGVPDVDSSHTTMALVDPVMAALPPSTAQPILVALGSPASLGVSSGLVTELVNRGYDVRVPDGIASRYGAARAIGNQSAVRLEAVVGDDLVTFQPSPGQQLIASYDPLTPDQRADYERLRPRVTAEYLAGLDHHAAPDPLSPADRDRFTALQQLGTPAAVYLDTRQG